MEEKNGTQTLAAGGLVEYLGGEGLRELISLLCNPSETDGADAVLVLDGGKLRSMPLASLTELLATGVAFIVRATPSDATVTINGVERASAFVEFGTEVEWEVSKDGYVTKRGSQTVTENTTINVDLAEGARFTIVPTPEDADVYINGEKTNSVYVEKGSTVEWEVSEAGYTTKTGSQVVDGDTTIAVELAEATFTFKYNYTGSNSPQIYYGTSNNANATIFCCDGDFYVEVNGVEVQSGGATLALGDYMTEGENEVKVYPLSGAKMYRAYRFLNYSRYTQYITEVVSWGNCEWGACDYLLLNTGIKYVPPFSKGFAGVTDFSYCFSDCSGLTEIPTGLFDNCPLVTTFADCFIGCKGLTSLPTGLFDNCPLVTTFADCFSDCTGLTSLPTGLFDNCPLVTTFADCFYNCRGLTEIPENLFINCTKVTDFSYCFNSGSSSVNNLEGESAFDRVDIDGVETIIHLYERSNYPDLYTAPTTTTYCYRYQTKLDDYDSIPSGWK